MATEFKKQSIPKKTGVSALGLSLREESPGKSNLKSNPSTLVEQNTVQITKLDSVQTVTPQTAQTKLALDIPQITERQKAIDISPKKYADEIPSEEVTLTQKPSTQSLSALTSTSLKSAIRLTRQPSGTSWSPSCVDIIRKPSICSIHSIHPLQSPSSQTSSLSGLSFHVNQNTPKMVPTSAASFLNQLYQQTTFSLSQPDEEFQIGDVIGNYTLVKEVGVGAFSKVYEAVSVIKPDFIVDEESMDLKDQRESEVTREQYESIHRDSTMAMMNPKTYSLALKITQLNTKRSISRETQIWSRLRHRNILHLVELFQLDDVCVLVSELGDCSLLDYIKDRGSPGLTENQTLVFLAELSDGLSYLHGIGIIHRDLKLENILLKGTTIKIGDFGMAEEYVGQGHPEGCMGLCCSGIEKKRIRGHDLVLEPAMCNEETCGSIHYLSPEDLCPTPHRLPTPGCDMWALGCILYAMLTGSLPFNDTFLPRLQMSIINAKFDVERLERYRVSTKTIDVVNRLLEKEVEKRWDVERVRKHLA